MDLIAIAKNLPFRGSSKISLRISLRSSGLATASGNPPEQAGASSVPRPADVACEELSPHGVLYTQSTRTIRSLVLLSSSLSKVRTGA